MFFFFFFKQKTAYEMRISDWSSDVCSSDLFDPGFFVDGWTGAVDANIASKGGAREDDGYDATVDIPHIGGQLRGRALDGHAHAELKALASSTVQPVYSGEVALSAGNSRIDAEGRVDKVIAIDARLSPLHLDDLLPEIGRAHV